MKKNLKTRYRKLQDEVYAELRNLLNKSEIDSKFIEGKCIRVDLPLGKEIVLVNDRITIIDHDGYYYDISLLDLDNLIDVIENYEKSDKVKFENLQIKR